MTPKNDWNNYVKVHVRTCSIDSLYMYFDTFTCRKMKYKNIHVWLVK